EPADLLGRAGRGEGGAGLGPGRAARRDQDGALRRARPQPALGHPGVRRLLAGRPRLARAGQECRPEETRPALSPAAAVFPQPRTTPARGPALTRSAAFGGPGFLDGELGGRIRFQTLVGDRLAAADRSAVGALV